MRDVNGSIRVRDISETPERIHHVSGDGRSRGDRGRLRARDIHEPNDSRCRADDEVFGVGHCTDLPTKCAILRPKKDTVFSKRSRKKLYAKYAVKFTLDEPAPVARTIATENSPSRGNLNAPVTVVMFSDFQCSHCAATHPVLQKVIGEYKDKIRFVVRDFPLVSIHGNAFNAALAANAAKNQGKFFEYIEILYKNQDNLDKESLKKYAASLNLNLKQFELDLNDEKNAAAVQKDVADGESYGIRSTPTILSTASKRVTFPKKVCAVQSKKRWKNDSRFKIQDFIVTNRSPRVSRAADRIAASTSKVRPFQI